MLAARLLPLPLPSDDGYDHFGRGPPALFKAALCDGRPMLVRAGVVGAASMLAGLAASSAVAQTQQQIEWCETRAAQKSPVQRR